MTLLLTATERLAVVMRVEACLWKVSEVDRDVVLVSSPCS